MKITIENFKSIQKLDNFEFKPLNIIAGINSSGKTSLTQCLLIIKQTLNREFAGVLNYKGEYFSVMTPFDLVYGKKSTNNLHIGLTLTKDELIAANAYSDLQSYKENVTELCLDVAFQVNDTIDVRSIQVMLRYNNEYESVKVSKVIRSKENKGYYRITNSSSKNIEHDVVKAGTYFKVEFINFFPTYAQVIKNVNGKLGIMPLPIMKVAREALIHFFGGFNYIGPLRIAPVPILSLTSESFDSVGIKGEYTRFILHKYSEYLVDKNETLSQVTKKWICDVFHLAQNIKVTRDSTNSYRVKVVFDNQNVDLYQVGFGLSQILPIVVQGLMTKKGGIFFVDSPEVHLHPSVQSSLVDFFSYLSKRGVCVLIETHSDHIITRIRRRIAERKINIEDLKICFVTHEAQGSEYQELSINDKGTFYQSLPKGFYDTLDEDFKEIIKAKFHE